MNTPETFEPRLVTATLTAVTDDVAIVAAVGPDGSELTGVMPRTEWFSNLPWTRGDRVQALQLTAGPQALFSVAHPDVLAALFEGVSPEVRAGAVRVMGVARVPGVRAKVAVAATDPTVNALMTCVGKSANRVRHVSTLAWGERIDIVAWHPEQAEYLRHALAPADAVAVTVDGDVATVTVPAHQMSAAVGQAGLNSQLAGQLVGLSVTIVPDSEPAARAA